ncbi:MAG TPA: hypothetical protein VGN97_04540 [Mesorhizobium sp.]|jgi:hypothetical protein|nr:hypothetical protein [Mesorhizobium sp.]
MTRILLASVLALAAPSLALAASATNLDAEPQTLVVTEGADRTELIVAPGETVEFCAGGCFVTLPNGDREALTGTETLEISGGAGQIR